MSFFFWLCHFKHFVVKNASQWWKAHSFCNAMNNVLLLPLLLPHVLIGSQSHSLGLTFRLLQVPLFCSDGRVLIVSDDKVHIVIIGCSSMLLLFCWRVKIREQSTRTRCKSGDDAWAIFFQRLFSAFSSCSSASQKQCCTAYYLLLASVPARL